MNGASFSGITDEVQSAQDLRLGRRFTLQQDNDPKHTAKTTQERLRDKSLESPRVAKPEPGLEPDRTSGETLK